MKGANLPSDAGGAADNTLRIGLLALPDVTGTGLFAMYDLFGNVSMPPPLAGREPAARRNVEQTIVAPRKDMLRSASGLAVAPHATLADAPEFDIVCVPNLRLQAEGPFERYFSPDVVEWLRARHAAGATLASACSGSMLLAETGLLDGHEATTHWYYAPVFRQRYPRVALRAERVLVTSGADRRIITAGGASSWNDLALYLIARFCGGEHAVQIAKLFLLNWHPEGQLPYAAAMLTQLQHADAAVRRAQEWLAQHYATRNPIGDAVVQSGLTERTFKRRFKAATGFAPLEYVQGLRLEAAAQLLEKSDDQVEEIAYRVGYEDVTFFRRLFRRHKGLTPAEYRRKFRAVHLGAL